MNGSAPRSKEEGQKRPDKKPVVPSAVWHGTKKAALEEGRKTASHLGHRIRRAPKAPSASIKKPSFLSYDLPPRRRVWPEEREKRKKGTAPKTLAQFTTENPLSSPSTLREPTAEKDHRSKKRRFRFGVSSTISPLLPCRFPQASHLDAPRGGGKGRTSPMMMPSLQAFFLLFSQQDLSSVACLLIPHLCVCAREGGGSLWAGMKKRPPSSLDGWREGLARMVGR